MTDKSNNLIEIAKANGAIELERAGIVGLHKGAIVISNLAQLQATIDAVNSTAEPTYWHWMHVLTDGSNEVIDSGLSTSRVEETNDTKWDGGSVKTVVYKLYKHPPPSTGDYIKRSDVLQTISDYYWACLSNTLSAAINSIPSIAVNKPDNAHTSEEVSDALPVESVGYFYSGRRKQPNVRLEEWLSISENDHWPVDQWDEITVSKVYLSPPNATIPSQSNEAVNDALVWYQEKATAIHRYLAGKPPQDKALLAVIAELSLDNGTRASSALIKKG